MNYCAHEISDTLRILLLFIVELNAIALSPSGVFAVADVVIVDNDDRRKCELDWLRLTPLSLIWFIFNVAQI